MRKELLEEISKLRGSYGNQFVSDVEQIIRLKFDAEQTDTPETEQPHQPFFSQAKSYVIQAAIIVIGIILLFAFRELIYVIGGGAEVPFGAAFIQKILITIATLIIGYGVSDLVMMLFDGLLYRYGHQHKWPNFSVYEDLKNPDSPEKRFKICTYYSVKFAILFAFCWVVSGYLS
jgi:hypothetical protein